MSRPAEAYRWLLSGRVQGVGFRWFVQRRAEQIGLAGWVRNLPDGRVEVAALGSRERLDRLEAALSEGPRSARVESVDKTSIPHEGIDPNFFYIK